MTAEKGPIENVRLDGAGLAPRDTRTPAEIADLRELIVSMHQPSAGAIRNMRRVGERHNPYLGK